MSFFPGHPYKDHTLTYDNIDNPFNTGTTERIIYALLIKLTNQCIQRDKELDRRLLLEDNLELPKLPANPAFIKRLISKFDFNFSVSMLEFKIYQLLPSPKGRETYERFDSFFEKSIQILEAFHYHYLKHTLNQETRKRKDNREAINRILLAAASDDKLDPMNAKALAIYINNQLLAIPRELDNEEIFIEYKSHLPKKVIKTRTTIKRNYKVADTRTEPIIKLNPWTSPRKVSEHFERNNWKDNEIDTWREQQRTDYFNQKEQAKKYMLKTVAPRHSFIIDYFFPGDYIYLLAININTRKAYAIPPDTIKEVSKIRYIIDKRGNKTREQAVKLLNKLIKEAKNVKHILCDQESAFISKEFKDECKKHKIELKHYIKNHMDGVIETTDKSRGIHNALSLISPILTIKSIKKDDEVGYDLTYKCKENGYLYILPIGYGQGLFRYKESVAFIDNLFIKQAGKISMDYATYFSTNLIDINKEVELFGKKIPIESLCKINDISPHEIIVSLKVKKEYHKLTLK